MVRTSRTRRGFSMVEVLIALMLTGTLLAATLSALDTSFKAYRATTEGASTNVIARLVIHRVSSMIRTGTDFGPYPDDVLDSAQNPLLTTQMEFKVAGNADGTWGRYVRLERRDAVDPQNGPRELWYVESEVNSGVVTVTTQRPLLTGLEDIRFTLEYDVGPRLKRATIDMTVRPNDFQDARMVTDLDTPALRLVGSAAPRKLED